MRLPVLLSILTGDAVQKSVRKELRYQGDSGHA